MYCTFPWTVYKKGGRVVMNKRWTDSVCIINPWMWWHFRTLTFKHQGSHVPACHTISTLLDFT